MDDTQKEIIDENLKLEVVTTYVQSIVDNDDIQNIKDQLNRLTISINELIRFTKNDKIYYLLLSILNKVLSINPDVNDSTVEILYNIVDSGIEDVNFQKKVLVELKKYLNLIKKTKNYNNLSLIVEILYYINSLIEIRKVNIETADNIWNCAISNISYIPANEPSNYESNRLKQKIENGIQKLKR